MHQRKLQKFFLNTYCSYMFYLLNSCGSNSLGPYFCTDYNAYSARDQQASVTLFASVPTLCCETMKMMMRGCHGRLSFCESAGALAIQAWPTRFTLCAPLRASTPNVNLILWLANLNFWRSPNCTLVVHVNYWSLRVLLKIKCTYYVNTPWGIKIAPFYYRTNFDFFGRSTLREICDKKVMYLTRFMQLHYLVKTWRYFWQQYRALHISASRGKTITFENASLLQSR